MDEENEPIKSVFNRREDGTFGEGNIANPYGRPRKGQSLTDIVREILLEESDGVTIKEKLARNVVNNALNGNSNMVKLLWRYLDGEPKDQTYIQKTETATQEELDAYYQVILGMGKIFFEKELKKKYGIVDNPSSLLNVEPTTP